ncbi:MAG: hypothetical protein FJX67_13630 [Alphaproteobacteria bacterium]|nr:hypothetical protein [Alphaproteobacteria bacterium]
MTPLPGLSGGRSLIERLREAVTPHADRIGLVGFLVFIATFALFDASVRRVAVYAALVPFLVLLADRDTLRAILRDPLFRATALWGAWLSAITCVEAANDWPRALDRFRYFLLILGFVGLTAYLAARVRNLATSVGWTLLATAAIAGAIATILHLGSANERLVPIGQGGDILYGATNFGIAIAAAAAFLYRPSSRAGWRVAVIAVALLVLVLAMALAQARGALLALVIAMAVLAAAGRRYRIPMLAVLVALVAAALLFADLEAFHARLDSYRLLIWSEAGRLIADRPWLGYGLVAKLEFGTLADGHRFTNPHSIFLGNQLYGGVVASALLLAMLTLFAPAAIRALRLHADPLPLAIMVFGLVTGLTHGYTLIEPPNPSWLFFHLPIGLAIGAKLRDEA